VITATEIVAAIATVIVTEIITDNGTIEVISKIEAIIGAMIRGISPAEYTLLTISPSILIIRTTSNPIARIPPPR
jgi:hypothetical protein